MWFYDTFCFFYYFYVIMQQNMFFSEKNLSVCKTDKQYVIKLNSHFWNQFFPTQNDLPIYFWTQNSISRSILHIIAWTKFFCRFNDFSLFEGYLFLNLFSPRSKLLASYTICHKRHYDITMISYDILMALKNNNII